MSVDLNRLVELVEAFPRQRVVVLGDLVADEFVYGDIARVSREAPVLILRRRESRILPGGAANAAANLAAVGARVAPVGVVGDDAPGQALLACFVQQGVGTGGIVTARGWTTPTKARFLAGWTHTSSQQVLRVDSEPQAPPSEHVRATLLARAQRELRGGALLVSDYGFGAASPAMVRRLRSKLVTLDSRYSLLEYAGAGVTAATPNEPELEALHHTRIGTDIAMLEQLGARTLRKLGAEALVVTRGKDGMAVFDRRGRPRHVPVYGSEEAVDVTGAGDTVIAIFTVALAAGATFFEAAVLANYAGGIVVMKRGTAAVSREELLAAIHAEATSQPAR